MTREPLSADDITRAGDLLDSITRHFDATVVGQRQLRDVLVATLIGRGHALLESVPGLAKTLAARTLASGVNGSFSRIQCTPDLLPSDIIGTQIFDQHRSSFTTELGPVHAHFVLLDEINRSSAKTQSAMLEAMQERQTSIGGHSHRLPDPFMVIATQNPIEEEGTYVLPQAQMDRFLVKEIVPYPSAAEEVEVLERIELDVFDTPRPPVTSTADIRHLQDLAARVHVDRVIKDYVVSLITVTRDPGTYLDTDVAGCIEYGASPRGSIAFLQLARARALTQGRGHVVPDDVVAFRHPVLRHRIVLTLEALADQVSVESVIDGVFAAVPTP